MRSFRTALSSLLVLSSCGPSGPSVPADCDRHVVPGADDTRAVNEALIGIGDGETFCFLPGHYHFTGPIDFRDLDGLTVRGTGATREETVLDFATETEDAKGMRFTAVNDLLVENLTLLDAPGDNLFVTGSTGVTLRNLSTGWMARTPAGRYAVYPVQSTNVLVEDVLAFGSADAGIYVGQATHCIVRDSEARGNVAGIEIENSTDCEVVGNEAHDNTGGILVFELPGLPQHGSGTLVRDNDVHDNDVANFAEAGSIVSILPTGTGVMVLAANDVEVTANSITGNDAMAIFALSYDTAVVGGAPEPTDATYDTRLEDLWIHDNTYGDNGGMPPESLVVIAGALGITTFEDVLWDGFAPDGGTDDDSICYMDTGTFRDVDVPGNFAMSSTDASLHDCTGTPRPRVMF